MPSSAVASRPAVSPSATPPRTELWIVAPSLAPVRATVVLATPRLPWLVIVVPLAAPSRRAAVRKLLVSPPLPTMTGLSPSLAVSFMRFPTTLAVTPAAELLIKPKTELELASSTPSLITVSASILICTPLMVNVPAVGVIENPASASFSCISRPRPSSLAPAAPVDVAKRSTHTLYVPVVAVEFALADTILSAEDAADLTLNTDADLSDAALDFSVDSLIPTSRHASDLVFIAFCRCCINSTGLRSTAMSCSMS